MKNYTIYCTKEQTKRAKSLGAPIEYQPRHRCIGDYHMPSNQPGWEWIIPTAEQMIGWLEEKGIIVHSLKMLRDGFFCTLEDEEKIWHCKELYSTKKEALIAAINEAFEYLEKKK